MVKFEKWDFPDQMIRQEIWRSYVQKFISLTIFVLLSYDGLFDFTFLDSFLGTDFQGKVEEKLKN